MDAIVKGPNIEFAAYNKDKLLDNGDRREPILAARLALDAPYH